MHRLVLGLSIFLPLLALLGPARLARADEPRPPAPDDLVGVWRAERTAGPSLRGTLLLARDGAAFEARIDGRTAPVEVDGGTLHASFGDGDDAGAFRGALESDGSVRGHWIQPRGRFDGTAWATPVTLSRVGPETATGDRAEAVWKGNVQPLDDRLTLFLEIERRGEEVDGEIHASLRNPERNVGRFLRLGRVHVDPKSHDIVIDRRDSDDELLRGRRHVEPERISIHVDGLTFDFAPVEETAEAVHGLHRPLPIGDGWPVAAFTEARLDPAPIRALVERVRASGEPAIQAVLVARGGKLVVEETFDGFTAERPHDTRSAGKSLASLLVGTAVDRGVFTVDASILPLLARRWPVDEPDPRLAAVTVEHLLTMSAGFECDDSDPESPGNEDRMQSQREQPDWIRYILDVPMARPPGDRTVYCTAALNLLGGVLAETAGPDGGPVWLPTLIDDALMRPLGIDRYAINLMPTGDAYLGGGWHFPPRELLKFAQLVLDGGVWRGERVLSEDWIRRSLEPHGSLRADGDYGYAWYRNEYEHAGRTVEAFEARGNGGQFLLVVPELDLAALVLGGGYGERAIWTAIHDEVVPKHLLAAIAPDAE